jgi:hypothetical protein
LEMTALTLDIFWGALEWVKSCNQDIGEEE